MNILTCRLVGWLYGVSNLFVSFNAETNFEQFSSV